MSIAKGSSTPFVYNTWTLWTFHIHTISGRPKHVIQKATSVRQAENSATEVLPDTCCVVKCLPSAAILPSGSYKQRGKIARWLLYVRWNFVCILVREVRCVANNTTCNWIYFCINADWVTVFRSPYLSVSCVSNQVAGRILLTWPIAQGLSSPCV